MSNPTRFPVGVSTENVGKQLGNYKSPAPYAMHEYFDDFDQYVAGDWTVTASTGTTALTAYNGGAILQTTAASANDIQANTKNPASFVFTAGKQAWFDWRGQISDATATVFLAGLITGGTAVAPTDGVYFTKAGAATSVSLVIKTGANSTTVASVATMANATDIELAFYYDGKAVPTLYIFVNKVLVATTQTFTNLPTSTLAPSFGVETTAAAAKTLTTDYLLASVER